MPLEDWWCTISGRSSVARQRPQCGHPHRRSSIRRRAPVGRDRRLICRSARASRGNDFNHQQQRLDFDSTRALVLVGRNGQDKEIGAGRHVGMEEMSAGEARTSPKAGARDSSRENQQPRDSPLMSRGRGRRHNQLPAMYFVAIAVVRERATLAPVQCFAVCGIPI